MIFGDPYRFAIWVEYLPQWGEAFKNGLFNLMVNGNLYPNDIRTATLSTDLFEIIDNECALISLPENKDVFDMSVENAFDFLLKLAYPESTEENEYPDQILDYSILSSNISGYGAHFFAVANKNAVRIIGGKTEYLIQESSKKINVWEDIKNPLLEDIILPKDEINKIMNDLKKYTHSLFYKTNP